MAISLDIYTQADQPFLRVACGVPSSAEEQHSRGVLVGAAQINEPVGHCVKNCLREGKRRL